MADSLRIGFLCRGRNYTFIKLNHRRVKNKQEKLIKNIKEKKRKLTLPLSHMRSWLKEGLTATVVVVQRWLGSRVTLILSLTGKIRVSSLFPQYLITAMLVGVWAVTISTQFCESPAIFNTTPSLGRKWRVWQWLRKRIRSLIPERLIATEFD